MNEDENESKEIRIQAQIKQMNKMRLGNMLKKNL